MLKSTTALVAGTIGAASLGFAAIAQDVPTHTVPLIDGTGASIGAVEIKQGPTGVLMVVEASGLTPGWHGIHLHETGMCEAPFTSAGAHINHTDTKAPHGLLNAQGPDQGDLPNIWADAQGNAKAELFTTSARLTPEGNGQWLLDEDGAAIVIHANADDHTSQPIGGAGARVACGAILSQ